MSWGPAQPTSGMKTARLRNVCFFLSCSEHVGETLGMGASMGEQWPHTAEKECHWPAGPETLSICPQNCQELPDISWPAADVAPEHGRETHEEEVLHGGRHVPGARGRPGGWVPGHAGRPQLLARGQRQLSGGDKFSSACRAAVLTWGEYSCPPPQQACVSLWRHIWLVHLGVTSDTYNKLGTLLNGLECLSVPATKNYLAPNINH